MNRQPRLKYAALTLAGLCMAAAGAVGAVEVTVVMSGLDNPRGLAFDPRGALHVAEAGRGGSGPCAPTRTSNACLGMTGAVSRLWRGRQQRVVSGLPSLTDPHGQEVTGPNGISFQGGVAYVSIGYIGDHPDRRVEWGRRGSLLGTLMRITPGGRVSIAADVAAYEGTHNPAGGPVETNPFGVLAGPGGTYVTDAAGNALLRVAANGRLSTVAAFPARPFRDTDSVPTGVVRGPDGALYVGELTGAPFADGSAVIYRIHAGRPAKVWKSGFKTIIGLAFAPNGDLYVLQHATGPVFFAGPGQLLRVARNGSRKVVLAGLERPTGIAVGPDGAVYVSNRGITAMGGEVLRIVP